MTPAEAVALIVGGCTVVVLAAAAAELRWRRKVIEHRLRRLVDDVNAAHSQIAHERWHRARLAGRVARLESADGDPPSAVAPGSTTNGRHP